MTGVATPCPENLFSDAKKLIFWRYLSSGWNCLGRHQLHCPSKTLSDDGLPYFGFAVLRGHIQTFCVSNTIHRPIILCRDWPAFAGAGCSCAIAEFSFSSKSFSYVCMLLIIVQRTTFGAISRTNNSIRSSLVALLRASDITMCPVGAVDKLDNSDEQQISLFKEVSLRPSFMMTWRLASCSIIYATSDFWILLFPS